MDHNIDLQQEIHKTLDNNLSMIYRIALQNVQNIEVAEDIAQDVCIKLIETDTVFKDEEHIKAWLITVTLNMCRDFYRISNRRKSVPIDEITISISDNYKVEHIDLFNALFKLRKTYRNVLYLYYNEDYKIQEIANIMNKTKSTINTWLRRAREELAQIIGEEE